MPNEPTLPTDLMTMLAGIGRRAVEYLPEEPKVTPPLTFLEPFYGAGKAPQLSLRDIGSFLIPQTALDVGLTMVPGGRPGKRGKTLFEKLVAKEAAPKSQLVPAIKRLDTGEVLPGKLGQDIWHQQVMKRYGFPENPAIQRNKIVEGFVDSETGEWLDLEQGAKAVGDWAERAAKSRGVQAMPQQATEAVTLPESAKYVSHKTRDIIAKRTEAKIVPAIRDNSGKTYVGRLGNDIYHRDVFDNYNLEKSRGWKYYESEGQYKNGFVDTTSGKWLSHTEANELARSRLAAKSRGVQGMASQATRAKIGEPVPAGSVKRTTQQVNPRVVPFEEAVVGPSNRFVPIVKDPNTGKVYRGVVEDSSHMDVMKRYGIDKYQSPSGPERFERGFVDIVTGEEKFMGTFTKSVAKPAPKPKLEYWYPDKEPLVPAMKIPSGEVLQGVPGVDTIHAQLRDSWKVKLEMGNVDPKTIKNGFVSTVTGKWVPWEEYHGNQEKYFRVPPWRSWGDKKIKGVALADELSEQLASKAAPLGKPVKKATAPKPKAPEFDFYVPPGKDPVVPAIRDTEGKVFAGIPGEDFMHEQVRKWHEHEIAGGPWGRVDYGFKDLKTGKWLDESHVNTHRNKYFRVLPEAELGSWAERQQLPGYKK